MTHLLSNRPLLSCCPGKGFTQVWGTSPESIDRAEDRDRWMELLTKLNIRQPAGGVCRWVSVVLGTSLNLKCRFLEF
jgi:hypothetical protein